VSQPLLLASLLPENPRLFQQFHRFRVEQQLENRFKK
jgi:hypothetical protein